MAMFADRTNTSTKMSRSALNGRLHLAVAAVSHANHAAAVCPGVDCSLQSTAAVDQSTTCRRCLFGKPDRDLLRRDLARHRRQLFTQSAAKWGFDYERRRPLDYGTPYVMAVESSMWEWTRCWPEVRCHRGLCSVDAETAAAAGRSGDDIDHVAYKDTTVDPNTSTSWVDSPAAPVPGRGHAIHRMAVDLQQCSNDENVRPTVDDVTSLHRRSMTSLARGVRRRTVRRVRQPSLTEYFLTVKRLQQLEK